MAIKNTNARCYKVYFTLDVDKTLEKRSETILAENEDDARLKVIAEYIDQEYGLPTFNGIELVNVDAVEPVDDVDDEEYNLYCEGRARGYELIREHILGEDVPEPVAAGIIDEFANFLIGIGLADEFRETLEHIEQLIDETEEGEEQ